MIKLKVMKYQVWVLNLVHINCLVCTLMMINSYLWAIILCSNRAHMVLKHTNRYGEPSVIQTKVLYPLDQTGLDCTTIDIKYPGFVCFFKITLISSNQTFHYCSLIKTNCNRLYNHLQWTSVYDLLSRSRFICLWDKSNCNQLIVIWSHFIAFGAAKSLIYVPKCVYWSLLCILCACATWKYWPECVLDSRELVLFRYN